MACQSTCARCAAVAGRAGLPSQLAWRAKDGADVQDRTGDLVLTKDALCQLSYIGLRPAASADTSACSSSFLRPTATLEWKTGLPAVARARFSCAKAGAGDGDRTRDQQLGRL